MDYGDFRTLFTGYVERYAADAEIFEVLVTDGRKQLQLQLPHTHWDDAIFPDIKPSNVGKPIPLAWGTLVNVPVVCTDEADSPGPSNWSFKIADTAAHPITSIDQVYVNGEVQSHSNEDLDEATFTLSTSVYDAGDTVTADIVGYEHDGTVVENALDVIVDILEHYGDVTFSSDTYNTTEWAAARALVPDVAIYDHHSHTLISAIEDICISVAGSFLVQNDGKYTFRLTDEARSSAMTILQDEQIGDPRAEFQTDRVLTSCIIEYSENHGEDSFLDFVDETREADIFDRYQTYRERIFKTRLNNKTDATALASTILDIA